MLIQDRNDLLISESFSLHLGPPKVYFIGKTHITHGLVFGGKVTLYTRYAFSFCDACIRIVNTMPAFKLKSIVQVLALGDQ